jgi:molybdopterin/thiamine biosynthesis adenylyltransferase/proteasome lid subunit RPN8/RPN11
LTPTTLVLPGAIAEELAQMSRDEDEAAAVLLVGVGSGEGSMRLIGRELHLVPNEHADREVDQLHIGSQGWVPALRRAAEIGATALWVHTHPGGRPIPSRRDAAVDEQLIETFRNRTGSSVYGSVVLSPRTDGIFEFTGKGRHGETAFRITRAWIVGDRMRLVDAQDSPSEQKLGEAFDRQVRAFGADIQNTLSQLHVGVVGVGGTGSATTEQLVRLGVRRLTVVDPDVLSTSNVTRVYGSCPELVGQAKVDVAVGHLARIAEDLNITPFVGAITQQEVARALTQCDVVFGCTDDEAGRLVLSRLSSYYVVPVIDCGVLIDSHKGQIRGIHARATVLHPGAPCLLCRGRIDPARAAAEMAPAEEHAKLVREGYAPELGGVEPAVVAFTTMAAALAVNELLERLVGYGVPENPSEVLFRIHDRDMSTNRRTPRSGHYCDPASGIIGSGDAQPFLGQVWLQ